MTRPPSFTAQQTPGEILNAPGGGSLVSWENPFAGSRPHRRFPELAAPAPKRSDCNRLRGTERIRAPE